MPKEATGRSHARNEIGSTIDTGPKVTLVGGTAYSSTGGIQAMNRLLVRELETLGILRHANFLWDSDSAVTADGQHARNRGVVSFYNLNRAMFVRSLVAQALLHPRDLWLCTHVNYGLFGLLANAWRSKRIGLMLHAAELDEDFTSLKRLALRRVGYVVAVSEYTKKKAIKLGVRPSRIHVLYNGVDDPCPDWRPATENRSVEKILFVGRMDERYKGQMELLDAMDLLARRLPRLRLVFVGGGRTLDDWSAEARRRGLTDVVEFVGRIPDARLDELYATAMVFAMPSENEGFGLVYAEAMARGIPCIGGDRDAAREVIIHGETGLCIPSGNSTALADAIVALTNSPGLRDAMGQAGRRRFVENFTASKYRERLKAAVTQWWHSLN